MESGPTGKRATAEESLKIVGLAKGRLTGQETRSKHGTSRNV